MLTENQEQKIVVKWCKDNDIKVVAVPNGCVLGGGKVKRARQMANLKSEGLAVGFPDLFIPVRRRDYGGLFVELKIEKGGVLSKSQMFWLEYLNNNGYYAKCCMGSEAAIKTILKYLHGIDKPVKDLV